ncbi:uncharacterized protein L969DRAFT_20004 [Mixia osmundae IAM 14324]|uniref:Secreted protein n=1 Tax=Mixia osmundae (strain CBS 9802 / IAM 14324 / JCM 22182 / KY 12970) TaxID=764103 RepID=G7E1E8_MIXOS|nr:uncharacterized protein L969DRAFT_20004 [Mixia osmundae IAM 14324]KEI36612.1 hypothetical protein L969DRAFT_20004 [Mixia osmundae IAM 14324]GAA96658.1 hypothetical protein E5Q_03329 [Mixia osmundae IAM 14324]
MKFIAAAAAVSAAITLVTASVTSVAPSGLASCSGGNTTVTLRDFDTNQVVFRSAWCIRYQVQTNGQVWSNLYAQMKNAQFRFLPGKPLQEWSINEFDVAGVDSAGKTVSFYLAYLWRGDLGEHYIKYATVQGFRLDGKDIYVAHDVVIDGTPRNGWPA